MRLRVTIRDLLNWDGLSKKNRLVARNLRVDPWLNHLPVACRCHVFVSPVAWRSLRRVFLSTIAANVPI